MSLADGISLDTGIGENPFFRCEPACREGIVRESEGATEGDDECDCTLNDAVVVSWLSLYHGAIHLQKPAPAGETHHAIHLEDTQRDQTCKGCGKDITGVED